MESRSNDLTPPPAGEQDNAGDNHAKTPPPPVQSSSDDSPGKSPEKKTTKESGSTKKGKKVRGKSKLVFEEDLKERTRIAKKRGDTLKAKATEFEQITQGKIHLRIQCVGGRSEPYVWTHGESFKLPGEADNPTEIVVHSTPDEAVLKRVLMESLREAAVSQREKSPVQSTSGAPAAKEQSSGGDVVFVSPHKLPPLVDRTKKGACYVCKNEEVVEGSAAYHSEWIGCNGEDRGKSCAMWVHSDCLGFPGATPEEIGNMPGHYCAAHVGQGRRDRQVRISYVRSANDGNKPAKGDGKGKGKKKAA